MARFTPYVYDQKKAKPIKNLLGETINPPVVLEKLFVIQNKIPVYVQWNMSLKSARHYFRAPPQTGLKSLEISEKQARKPYCVSSVIPFRFLEESMIDFWEAIAKKNFVLVWPSDVDPGTAVETTKVSKFSINAKDNAQATKLEELRLQSEADRELFEAKQAVSPEQETQINDRLMGLVSRVKAGELKHDAAARDIEEFADDLSEADLSWAIANSEGKIRKWLKETLAARSDDVAEEN